MLSCETLEVTHSIVLKNEELFDSTQPVGLNKGYPLLTDGESLYTIGKKVVTIFAPVVEKKKEGLTRITAAAAAAIATAVKRSAKKRADEALEAVAKAAPAVEKTQEQQKQEKDAEKKKPDEEVVDKEKKDEGVSDNSNA